jgi:hypothetical protein
MRFIGNLVWPLVLAGSVMLAPAKETAAVAAVPVDLAEYVAKAEPGFAWSVEDTKAVGEVKAWRLKLTSQVWQGITWTHDLLVVRRCMRRCWRGRSMRRWRSCWGCRISLCSMARRRMI